MTEKKRAQPEQQPPPVQRLRLRYVKRGRARFTSTRDFARAFERALRRAGVPMAYSSGFSPHPRISYANASPTGAATEAEFLEIGLSERRDPDWVREAISDALPDGMAIAEAVEAAGGSLADRLTASEWIIVFSGPTPDVVGRAVVALLAADTAPVERPGKDGSARMLDARTAIVELELVDGRTLRAVLAHTAPLIRTDDLVAALGALEPEFIVDGPPLSTRSLQGIWDGARIVGPFEA